MKNAENVAIYFLKKNCGWLRNVSGASEKLKCDTKTVSLAPCFVARADFLIMQCTRL